MTTLLTDRLASREHKLDASYGLICRGVTFLAFIRWILPLWSPLWLDETASWFRVRTGLMSILHRPDVFLMSTVYAAMLWAFQAVLGRSEWVLRLPSLLAMCAATYLLYRLSRRLVDREFALSAAAVYMLLHSVAFAACDARPYAFTMLAVIASTLLLVRWTGAGRIVDAIGYGLTAGLVVELHILFFVTLIAQAAYFAIRVKAGYRPGIGQVIAVCVCFGTVAALAIRDVMVLIRPGVPHSFTAAPNIKDLLAVVLPYDLLLAVIVAVLVFGTRPISFRLANMDSSSLFLIAAMALFPAILLYAASTRTAYSVFVPRYLLSASPGLALAFAVVLKSLDPPAVRAGIVAMAALVVLPNAMLSSTARIHEPYGAGDWKHALRYVEEAAKKDAAPVFIRSQYVESDAMDWRKQPLDENPLFPQLSYYRVHGVTLEPLPLTLSDAVVPDLNRYTASLVTSRGRFLLISAEGPKDLAPYLAWFGRLSCGGISRRKIAEFNGVVIYEFQWDAVKK